MRRINHFERTAKRRHKDADALDEAAATLRAQAAEYAESGSAVLERRAWDLRRQAAEYERTAQGKRREARALVCKTALGDVVPEALRRVLVRG